METQTQIDRLIELAIIQRSELKQLVEQLPQLREHLNAEVERTFEEAEPQIRTDLEEFVTRQAADKTATLGTALEAKIGELAKSLEDSAQAKYSALIATRDQNAALLAQAEERIAAAAGELPAKVKDIVAAELARFPRAGEIDQLRKEFAEPRGLNPRGKWQAGESYNKLDLVTINGDSYTSNIDGNRTRPSRSSADWTLVAARGTGGGGGPTSLSELTTVPSNGDILIGSGTSWVTSNLTAGAGISITVGAGEITISATDGDITLDDGTAASPSLHFTNDADTGLYRPAANTLGISVSGTQVAYFDTDGLTIPSSGVVAGGSFHGANGNANNPSFSFTSDQDTGFFRHGTDEIGISIGGTEKAVMTSTTFTVTPNLVVSGTGTINGTSIPASKTLVVTTDKLSALASTSSSELAGVISDETGTGALVFANTPTLVTPNIGAATGTSVNLSGAGTFGGNLTVSGTGTSSVAGSLGIGTTSPLASLHVANASSGLGTFNVGGTTSALGIQMEYSQGGFTTSTIYANNSYNNNAAVLKIGVGKTTNPNQLVMLGSGNLLVGTTTDSGNGKLQLATHTTSAGGIGFGTDTTLYRWQAGGLALDHIGASNPYLSFRANGTENGSLQASGGDFYITAMANKNMYLRTNGGTTALTLDSSQNFKLTPAVVSSIITTQSAPQIRMGSRASGRSNVVLDSTAGRVWSFENTGTSLTIGYSGLDAVTIAETTGDATFAGNVTLSTGLPELRLTNSTTTSPFGITFYNGGSYDASLRHQTNTGVLTLDVGRNSAWGGKFDIYCDTTRAARFTKTAVTIDQPTTFAGAIAIGNTVNTVSPTSPNRTITMVIGGTTYYLHAKTTND